MIGLLILSFSAGYSCITSTTEIADFWFSKVRFIGVASIPVFLFLFSLAMDGRKNLFSIGNIALLFALPLITLVIAFTNHNHHLFIKSIQYQTINGIIFRSTWEAGVWFWIHSIYSYLLLLMSLGLLFLAVLRKPHPYKSQAMLMFAGVLAPMVANLIVLSKILNISNLDLTALCLTITGIILGYALFRYRMLDLMPIARDTVVESISDAVIVLDRQQRIIDANPAAMKKLIPFSKNIIGTKIQDIWPVQFDFSGFQVPRKHIKMALNLRNEEEKIFDLNISRLYKRRGVWVGSLIVARDITELEIVEKKLEQSEKRFRTLFEDAPIAIRGYNLNGNIHFWNKISENIYGYSKKEAIGSNINDLIVPTDIQTKVNLVNKKLAETGEISAPEEFLLKSKNKDKVPVLSTFTVVNLEESEPELYCFDLDMTEQKRLQNNIIHTHKMNAIATLAGGIAHQFNNALSVITGNITLFEEQSSNIKKLAAMNNAATRMINLTSQLLAFSRGGKYYETIITFSDLVKELLPILTYKIDSSIKITADLSSATYNVKIDQLQVQMAISSILKNAIESIDEKGVIKIGCKNTTITGYANHRYPGLKPGDYAVLTITDTGCGMDEDTQKKVFDPFFTTHFHGRGLGMAAVYGVIKNHKGFIYIDSEPEKGTSVTVYLPKTIDVVQVQEKRIKHPLKGSNKNILVIEDEELVMDITAAMLKRLGFKVVQAKTGKEAIDRIRTLGDKIDLVLLDFLLPDMNGDAVYSVVKTTNPDLKVIICSGYSIDGPVKKTLEAGAIDFIQKPFTVEQLSEKLKSHLKKSDH